MQLGRKKRPARLSVHADDAAAEVEHRRAMILFGLFAASAPNHGRIYTGIRFELTW